jgi:hypothetical protein
LGLRGRLVSDSPNAMLAAGALQAAIGRIAREATQVDGFGGPPVAIA